MSFLAALFYLALLNCSSMTLASDLPGAAGLYNRVLGSRLGSTVRLEALDPNTFGEGFRVGSDGKQLVVEATSDLMAAAALNWYLQKHLHCTHDWDTFSTCGVENAQALPLPTSWSKFKKRKAKIVYANNVCTTGYSLSFADWQYWEKIIDWMAMQGVSAPLASIGLEKVIQRVFQDGFGVTFDELQEFLVGPGFTPWFQMGNLRKWGGPISQQYIDDRFELQKKILGRMRELKMTPVLPSFSGFVPEAFATKQSDPNAFVRANTWSGFRAPYSQVQTIRPDHPLYLQVGSAFARALKELYGTNHLYSADQYNEMTPSSGDLGYLRNASRALMDSLLAVDPDAVWIMQGWLFWNTAAWWTVDRIEAYLGGVPDERLILLDLYSDLRPVFERTKYFFGKPWVFNTLLNFGGQNGLYADIPKTQQNFALASQHEQSNLIGVGITMEGYWTNYVAFEFTLNLQWEDAITDASAWMDDFGSRRYGRMYNASALFSTLGKTVFGGKGFRGGIIQNVPSLPDGLPSQLERHELVARSLSDMRFVLPDGLFQQDFSSLLGLELGSSGSRVVQVWRQLIRLGDPLGSQPTFQFDVVDFGRQAMNEKAPELFKAFVDAYHAHDLDKAKQAADTFLDFMHDMDNLLSGSSSFMLGRWLEWARACASSSQEADLFEFNARNQITLWGPTGQIDGYAAKQWSGVISSYYIPRYQLFFDRAMDCIRNGKSWSQQAYRKELRDKVELPWQQSTTRFPAQPQSQRYFLEIANQLVEKYFAS